MTDDDFSFNVNKEVDKILGDKKPGKHSDKPVMDRVKFAHEIRKNPPAPGYMKTDVKPAIYSIDLNTDANWWFNHVCTVFPFLLDQAVRTHVDIRDSFKPEKRHLDFEYWWLILAVIGFFGLVILMNSIFKIF